jgi:hypothetical protein
MRVPPFHGAVRAAAPAHSNAAFTDIDPVHPDICIDLSRAIGISPVSGSGDARAEAAWQKS